ncbi:hypothetical protein VIGAN_11138300 [Vigna angularis var. angularis]|uniref:Homologous recombination OB-fold protein OB-fold domain-containing protein n=1 Tax=Vigna angularis var. angularis TaxID=157739 RepID=A0A0S3T9T4_PHAAN|nr:hypothetical protein VIGAN_11138300 [Vigna angularis var. angularis]
MDAWEDLVYDDDVLEPFLKKCDASATLIPGPAGNIQAAFMNRTGTEQPKSTQEFARDVADATYERDFNSNAWKWAQMFIEHHGTLNLIHASKNIITFNTCNLFSYFVIIGLVKDEKFENVNSLQEAKSAEVLPLVVCILKECKPNGLGDMQLTLKDPTATMKASLHKKALEDPEIAENIAVGSVIILNLVHPFTPFRQNHYLNITHRSIVKVFPAEVSPPTIDLVKETPKPVIRLPMWAEKELNVDDILRKFVRPSDQPSTSNQADNQ